MKNIKNKRNALSPNEIMSYIGKTFGCFEVIDYYYLTIRMVANKRSGYNYYYKVKCNVCGNETMMTREKLQFKSINNVDNCARCLKTNKQYMDSVVTTKMSNTQPYPTNTSTGIKHYHISQKRNGFSHIVKITIDNKMYIFIRKSLPSNLLDNECVKLATELNNILHKGSKQAFYDEILPTYQSLYVYDYTNNEIITTLNNITTSIGQFNDKFKQAVENTGKTLGGIKNLNNDNAYD